MKKLMLVLSLCAFVLAANSQPYATLVEELGQAISPGQTIDNGTRSVPPGTLLYSQTFMCPPYNGLRSETLTTDSETADDFIIPFPSTVETVRWWFSVSEDPNVTDWIIRIYDNPDCLPGGMIMEYYIPAGQVNYEQVCQAGFYDCWAPLGPPFVAGPGQPLWISIQAVGTADFWLTWGNPGEFQNCEGAFKSVFFGFPDFVPSGIPLGAPGDFCFELYGAELPCWNISLVGEFDAWGGAGDHWMDPDPGIPGVWHTWINLTNDMNLHGEPDIIEVKFRQDADWAVNWGGPDFPSGIAVHNGPNIPVPIRLDAPVDTYFVTFNCVTGEYSFLHQEEVPVAPWAIGLGVLLIVAVALVRYRRL